MVKKAGRRNSKTFNKTPHGRLSTDGNLNRALAREMRSVMAENGYVIDHQRKIAKRAKTDRLSVNDGLQAVVVTTDLGLVANWCITPTTSSTWYNPVCEEILSRHDEDNPPEGFVSHRLKGTVNYRGHPDILIKEYSSTSGTSKCETAHSVLERADSDWLNIGWNTLEAYVMWKLTHLNRNKLSALGFPVILAALSAMDDDTGMIMKNPHSKPLDFGFKHYRNVIAEATDKASKAAYEELLKELSTEESNDYGRDKSLVAYARASGLDPEKIAGDDADIKKQPVTVQKKMSVIP
mmetsp:Transcript_9640/g.23779  ORF Transcript_9640/g.23779 Transcript_9640/m.23779 type:complete len:294 (-) Transcript_9640:1156-2037(-)